MSFEKEFDINKLIKREKRDNNIIINSSIDINKFFKSNKEDKYNKDILFLRDKNNRLLGQRYDVNKLFKIRLEFFYILNSLIYSHEGGYNLTHKLNIEDFIFVDDEKRKVYIYVNLLKEDDRIKFSNKYELLHALNLFDEVFHFENIKTKYGEVELIVCKYEDFIEFLSKKIDLKEEDTFDKRKF